MECVGSHELRFMDSIMCILAVVTSLVSFLSLLDHMIGYKIFFVFSYLSKLFFFCIGHFLPFWGYKNNFQLEKISRYTVLIIFFRYCIYTWFDYSNYILKLDKFYFVSKIIRKSDKNWQKLPFDPFILRRHKKSRPNEKFSFFDY